MSLKKQIIFFAAMMIPAAIGGALALMFVKDELEEVVADVVSETVETEGEEV